MKRKSQSSSNTACRRARAVSPPSSPSFSRREESNIDAVPPAIDVPRGRGQANVTRERALYFATGEVVAPASAPTEETESWPGYYATIRELSNNRQAAQDARNRRQPVEELPKIVWTPKRCARASVLRHDYKVQRLRDLALKSLAEHIEQLPTLEYIDATARHQVARAVVKLRRLKPEVLPLFIFPGVTEIDIPDCSNIDEDTLICALKKCSALSVLRLGLCGRCVSDNVIHELGDALKSVEQLQVQGCYRLSDAGCEALVRRCAPSLDSFEISCNQRMTKKSIDYFSELQNLHSLTLSECPQIGDASLESLKTMHNLRKLQLNQMERLTDDFIVSISQSLQDLEEFSVSRCSQLTDVAVKGILNACRRLKVLDVSDLHLITDECFELVREHGHALRHVSLRCCLNLTDIAIQHIAFGAKLYLEILEMSSVSQATDDAVMALLEHCATSMTALDISFCRNISENALGMLADGAENLRFLVLWGCTQVTARFLTCHSLDDLIVTGHPLLTGLSIRSLGLLQCLCGRLRRIILSMIFTLGTGRLKQNRQLVIDGNDEMAKLMSGVSQISWA
ncbi:putative leucine-rich repeat domain superfamily [Plasmopara halstedii]